MWRTIVHNLGTMWWYSPFSNKQGCCFNIEDFALDWHRSCWNCRPRWHWRPNHLYFRSCRGSRCQTSALGLNQKCGWWGQTLLCNFLQESQYVQTHHHLFFVFRFCNRGAGPPIRTFVPQTSCRQIQHQQRLGKRAKTRKVHRGWQDVFLLRVGCQNVQSNRDNSERRPLVHVVLPETLFEQIRWLPAYRARRLDWVGSRNFNIVN